MLRLVLMGLGCFLASAAFGVTANMRMAMSTPLISADAYAQHDQVGVLQAVPDFFQSSGAALELVTVTLVDKGDVKHDIDIMFFGASVGVAADNAAAAVSDGDMGSFFMGSISFVEADYVDFGGNSASTKNVSMALKPQKGKVLYYLLVCRDGTGCDWAAVGDLVFKFAFHE